MDSILVSIVILTKNGGKIFQDCICKIFSQKTSFSFEVLAVDSGSTDKTVDSIKSHPIRFFQVEPDSFCFGKTRDFGFDQAAGKFIVTVSQDVIPKGDYWLENLVSPLLSDTADIVQGKECYGNDREIFFWEKAGCFYFTRESVKFFKNYGGIGLSCSNMAVKKEVWNTIRFGNAIMNEDKAFQVKAFRKGLRIHRETKATVFHGHNYNLRTLMKRCENEGIGWRYAGIQYTFLDLLMDLFQPVWVYKKLMTGILNREIRSMSEMLFLIIRPICIYKGNMFNRTLKR